MLMNKWSFDTATIHFTFEIYSLIQWYTTFTHFSVAKRQIIAVVVEDFAQKAFITHYVGFKHTINIKGTVTQIM